MLKIYLLRHGTTIFNTQDTVQGWNDSPLTENGQFQAKCAGYGLRETKFEKCYSGDLPRQINTAKLFLSENMHNTSIIEDMHFREMNYGKYQFGTYFDMLNPLFLANNATYCGYTGLYKYMDDVEIATQIALRDETGQTEGPIKLWNRFKQGLDNITNNDDGNILLSTSSCAIAVVIKNLFPDFKQDGLVDNCSITVISYKDGQYSLEDYNNTTYRNIGENYYKQ